MTAELFQYEEVKIEIMFETTILMTVVRYYGCKYDNSVTQKQSVEEKACMNKLNYSRALTILAMQPSVES